MYHKTRIPGIPVALAAFNHQDADAASPWLNFSCAVDRHIAACSVAWTTLTGRMQRARPTRPRRTSAVVAGNSNSGFI